jgi:hypothetical protein
MPWLDGGDRALDQVVRRPALDNPGPAENFPALWAHAGFVRVVDGDQAWLALYQTARTPLCVGV